MEIMPRHHELQTTETVITRQTCIKYINCYLIANASFRLTECLQIYLFAIFIGQDRFAKWTNVEAIFLFPKCKLKLNLIVIDSVLEKVLTWSENGQIDRCCCCPHVRRMIERSFFFFFAANRKEIAY